ncbi:hypothetical protein PROVRUST_06251 [Providencia rustigianii DSM 4541]|uniref:Uncharacterized protein n=1 Tax=Providencia rustigianii DSM 4541 TaxID=500637 RepID=D1P228_9GAMM|nr:hypothetical protein PROVRUST_06251 [Providencia rustigianii DSM 4541]
MTHKLMNIIMRMKKIMMMKIVLIIILTAVAHHPQQMMISNPLKLVKSVLVGLFGVWTARVVQQK